MNIEQKFLELTNRTYPHGTEQDLFHLLPDNLETDEFGNKFIYIGENPSTMFTCHLDTASSRVDEVRHKFDGNYIKTDGRTILGADDKAGCVILLNMIEHKIKGLYYFFLGEERGCVGSRQVSSKHKTNPIPSINKVISFDRRGTNSVITHQLGGRCCSEKFGRALSIELNKNSEDFKYTNDSTGIYTDSAQFTDIYPECTNISVGYYDEHSTSERQDIVHLRKLSEACLSVDWNNLPIDRSTNDHGYEPYETDEDWNIDRIWGTGSYEVNEKNQHRSTYFFIDPIYNHKSSITIGGYTKKIIDTDFDDNRIEMELDLIEDLFTHFDIEYLNLEWDGRELQITYNETHTSSMYREELSEYIDTLNFWKREVNI